MEKGNLQDNYYYQCIGPAHLCTGTCMVITTESDACCNSEKQNWTNYKKLFSRKAHNKAQQ